MVDDPVNAILIRTWNVLDAVDFAGAFGAAESLVGPPRQATAFWLYDAKALLDARSSLVQLEAQA